MRIFYVSDTTPNAYFDSNLWRNNLYLPLVDLGHDVVEFQGDLRETFRNLDPSDPPQRAFIERNRPVLSAEILRQVREAHRRKPVDLFFSYLYDACIVPEAVDEIRSLGIRTVNWYCNGSYQLHLVREISPHYDHCLVPEKFRLADYRAMGARPIYCQEAANPNVYRPVDVPQDLPVSFVGQAYGDRPAYVAHLLSRGIDVRVWGRGWQALAASRHGPVQRLRRRWRNWARRIRRRPQLPAVVVLPDAIVGGVLDDEEVIATYSRSKVNLGFSAVGDTHRDGQRILQVRLRDFEVPMSGGFYMVEYMEELEEFFEIGKEVVCYRSPEDLGSKIAYYLSHDAEREAIRRAGRERCLRDHSWHRRFQDAFRAMGLPSGP